MTTTATATTPAGCAATRALAGLLPTPSPADSVATVATYAPSPPNSTLNLCSASSPFEYHRQQLHHHMTLADLPLPLALSGLTNDLDTSLVERDAFAVNLSRSPAGSPWGVFSRPNVSTIRSPPGAGAGTATAPATATASAPAPVTVAATASPPMKSPGPPQAGFQSLGQALVMVGPHPAPVPAPLEGDEESAYNTPSGDPAPPRSAQAEFLGQSQESEPDPDGASSSASTAVPPPQYQHSYPYQHQHQHQHRSQQQQQQQQQQQPSQQARAQGASGPFDHSTAFDMMDMTAPSGGKAKRSLPNPTVHNLRSDASPKSAAPTSQGSPATSAGGAGSTGTGTDLLSGSPAPGAMSSTPTSPSGGGQAPLVPSKASDSAGGGGSATGGGGKGRTGAEHRGTAHVRGQSVSQGTPDSAEDGEEYKGKYLAAEFAHQLKAEAGGRGSPARENSGLTLRPPGAAGLPQRLTITTHTPNLESLFLPEEGAAGAPVVQPITIFPSPPQFFPGHKVVVDGHITYATKLGRIRVIDQNSGARMMLKKHDARVADMAMGQPTRGMGPGAGGQGSSAGVGAGAGAGAGAGGGGAGSGGRRWRCLASVAFDGRLVIWKLPVRFGEENASYEVLAEVMAADDPHRGAPMRENRFTAVRWHPQDPALLLVATNDRRVVVLRLDRGAFEAAWRRGQPIGRPMGEVEAFHRQDVLPTKGEVSALAFSPDGSAFAYATVDNEVMVRQTSKPGWAIMSAQLSRDEPVTAFEFLSDGRGRPRGFVVAKAEGRKVEVWELSRMHAPSTVIELTSPPESEVEEDHDTIPLFGHFAWTPAYSTLLVSNSTRGSLMAFHLDFGSPAALESESAADDAGALERATARRQTAGGLPRGAISPAPSTVFVDHIAELPLSSPIVSFVVDAAMRQPPTPNLSTCSVYFVTPKGMQQTLMPLGMMQPAIAPPSTADVRRKSLAGEILVDVQIERAAESVEPLTFSESMPVGVDEDSTLRLPSSEITHLGPTERSTSTIVQRGPRPQYPEQTAAGMGMGTGMAGTASHWDAALVRELKKMEERLDGRLNQFIEEGLFKQEARLEEDRLAHQANEAARQEAILKVVSTTLTKNTSKTLESTIRSEIQATIMPAVSKLVQSSVDEQVRRGMAEAMKKTVPAELEKLLFRPDISAHISRSFAANVGPTIERNFGDAMRRTLVPAFTASATTMLEALVRETRAEITGVRKDIVAEQSNALTGAEQEIGELRRTVESLRTQMLNLQEVLRQFISSPSQSLNTASTVFTSIPYPTNAGQAQQPHHHQQPQQAQQSLPHLQQQQQQQQQAGPQPQHYSGMPVAQPSHDQPQYASPRHAQPAPVHQTQRDEQYRSPRQHAVMGPQSFPPTQAGALKDNVHDQPQMFQQPGRMPPQPQSQPQAPPPSSPPPPPPPPYAQPHMQPHMQRHMHQHHSPHGHPHMQPQMQKQQSPHGDAQPPERPRTPVGHYQDMFLRALSDKDSRTALADLIDGAPRHRLEAVFVRGGQWGQPVLNQTTVLTLAYELSRQVSASSEEVPGKGHEPAPLGVPGVDRLRWIWACIQAVDNQDLETAQYVERVLGLCSEQLVGRQAELQSIGCFDDVKAIREVLSLIHEKAHS